jgi:indolepyruvate ferredoxin oxidoreductase
VRIANGDARLLLGCDLVVSASGDSVSKLRPGHTHAIVNSYETITGDFTRNPDLSFPQQRLRRAVENAVGQGGTEFLDATGLATGLLGDSLATNLFMLGYAYQRGLVPVSAEAIERAIELNGAAVDFNLRAFGWGRRAALDLPLVAERATPPEALPDTHRLSESLDELVVRRSAFLTDYQNPAYAARYTTAIDRLRAAEAAVSDTAVLTDAAARALFKLMAYKDEYEVARLHTDGDFLKRVGQQFEGDYKLKFHLAPPLTAGRDPKTGHLQKREYGPRMLIAFRLLARLKRLRGTAFDIFGRTEERRAERQAIADYTALLDEIAANLTEANHPTAVELAGVPLEIRGFGHVQAANRQRAAAKTASLLARFRGAESPQAVAAE